MPGGPREPAGRQPCAGDLGGGGSENLVGIAHGRTMDRRRFRFRSCIRSPPAGGHRGGTRRSARNRPTRRGGGCRGLPPECAPGNSSSPRRASGPTPPLRVALRHPARSRPEPGPLPNSDSRLGAHALPWPSRRDPLDLSGRPGRGLPPRSGRGPTSSSSAPVSVPAAVPPGREVG